MPKAFWKSDKSQYRSLEYLKLLAGPQRDNNYHNCWIIIWETKSVFIEITFCLGIQLLYMGCLIIFENPVS